MLSTCLVSTWFSSAGRQETTNRCLSLFDFARFARLGPCYSRFICTALSISLGTRTIGRCLVAATVAAIKLIYCTSIKQQERSYFRHLKKSMSGFKEHLPSWLCMLTHHFYTLSKPVSPVVNRCVAANVCLRRMLLQCAKLLQEVVMCNFFNRKMRCSVDLLQSVVIFKYFQSILC